MKGRDGMALKDESPEKVTVILQGRVGSTRLPGKVMLPLAGKPAMQHVYERILHCRNIDRVIVATSDKGRDNPVADLFHGLGVPVFRGSETDPLDRYYHAATHFCAKHIVRVMADCPLVDPEVVDGVIQTYIEGNYDYCYLGGEFPTGLDTTVFSYESLKRCWQKARLQSEREHIFLYMDHHPDRFNTGVYEKFKGLLHHRWVMDHEADYRFIKTVYDALYKPAHLFLTRDILNLLEKNPGMLQINAGIPRGEGVKKAQERDL